MRLEGTQTRRQFLQRTSGQGVVALPTLLPAHKGGFAPLKRGVRRLTAISKKGI